MALDTKALDREFDAMAQRKYKLSGAALMRKTEKGESGGRGDAVSSAGARGWAQFMPQTRQGVLKLTGGKVDPWRSRSEAMTAMKLHMTGKLGNAEGLEGYNPGGGQGYVRYILGQKVGDSASVPPATPDSSASKRRYLPGKPGSTQQDVAGSLIDAMLGHKFGSKTGLLQAAQSRLATGAYDSVTPATPGRYVGKDPAQRAPATKDGEGFTLAKGANRPGVELTAGLRETLSGISRLAGKLTVGTGTNHNQRTTTGNVSDHWSGNGADIPAAGSKLVRLGQDALIANGMPRAQARKQKGGAFTLRRGGKRVQVIFNSNVGGNHFDHLHVGVGK